MLLLITGSEAVGKRYLAKAIVNQLNTFTYGGHTVEFKTKLDGNNETFIDNVSSSEFSGDIDVVIWANELYERLFITYLGRCHLYDEHSDEYYDIGVNSDHIPYTGSTGDVLKYGYPYFEKEDSYHDVLKTYIERPSELVNLVFSGEFSSHYIQMLKDVLKDDFKAYNIIRNPSVSYLLNTKTEETLGDLVYSDLNIDVDFTKYDSSTMIAGALSSMDIVTNIEFEDIIKTGLVINGVDIELPPGYKAFNDHITVYEKEHHVKDDLTEANNALTVYDPLWWDNYVRNEPISKDELALLDEIKKAAPNIFDLYPDYAALTYEEITSS
jgi:hypothetical protein